MRAAIVLAVLFFVGCATGVREAFVKDGRQVFEAKCNGMQNTIADCHAQAAEMCNGKYDELGTDGKSSFAPMNGGYVPVQKRSLMFACKN